MPSSSKRPLFCIVDASSFIFRAYYAVRPLSNKAGLPTNAVFGFVQMILGILQELKPAYVAIVYDTKYPSFRKELYPEYKANRSAMPDDLVPQIPYIKKFIEALGLPNFELPGYEADDIIATFADQAAHKAKDADVYIVSSDKDLMQLVNSHVVLFDTMKNLKLGPKEVEEKLGVPPELVTDYLGIVGDSSDNIPGVKGIGPKGAVALLKEFGSVEGIYKNLDKVKKEGQRNQLIESRENAILSKHLATVVRDLKLKQDWHELHCRPKFGKELEEVLEELEFHSLLKRVRAGMTGDNHSSTEEIATPSDPAIPPAAAGDLVSVHQPEYQALRSKAELSAVFTRLASAKRVALDTETTGLQAHEAELVGFSFCVDPKEAFYVPLLHKNELGAIAEPQCPAGEALCLLAGFLKGKQLIGQNIKFDWNILRAQGLELDPKQIHFDSMLASFLLDAEGRHGLDVLADKYLGHKNIAFEDLCGSGKNQITFDRVPIEAATHYAAEDAHVAFLLAEFLAKELEPFPSLLKVMHTIDLPLIPVLADLEWEGIRIDEKLLKKMSKEFGDDLASIEARAYKIAGEEFNLASPKQLQKILFEKLALPTGKKTKTGFSTDVEVLEKLAEDHELPRLLLEHREISKLKGTYVDVLPVLALPNTHRVHTSFNQTIAATGRLSSTDPNLQNIPIRTESGRRIRSAFIAKPGCALVGADYSQVELRILASLSQDPSLCEAFTKGEDIHAKTAAQIFSIPLDKVDSDQRRKAKAVNFGILYGKTAFSLAEELAISRGEAADIIERYFARYPTIRGFLASLVENAKSHGYAETLYGRRRRLDNINAKNKMLAAMAERMAVNTPIQGTAADIIKLAMIDLWRELKAEGLEAKILLQVHDELVLEVPEKEVKAVMALVKRTMEGVGQKPGLPAITVPLTVECATASNWLDL